ncbi:MAG TPA: nuclear transport factor 2 family protein [Chloroflexia bacterium]|nr:nuclear transport factor 2 family protein [Chloroflexia bacterium]
MSTNGNNQDATSFMTQFDAAWNRHDLDAAVGYYADDAVVALEPAPPGLPGIFTGKDEIRGFIQMLLPGFHVESSNARANGDTLTWDSRITADAFRSMGVDEAECVTEVVVRDGKVQRFTPTFSPATLAKIQQSQAAAGL